jgi:hypothetical protein
MEAGTAVSVLVVCAFALNVTQAKPSVHKIVLLNPPPIEFVPSLCTSDHNLFFFSE